MKRRDFLITASSWALLAPPYRMVSAASPIKQKEMTPASRIFRGVTMYSYQEEYYQHAMTLEDCLAELQSIGATGVQMIAEEMVPDYPNPPQAWVDRWHEMLTKYQLTPTNLDTFVDVYVGGHRNMSLQESVDTLVSQIKLANRLGFNVVRPTTGSVEIPALEMVERALADAEKYDVRIAPEIHAPIPLQGNYVGSYLDLIHRTGTKHMGFTLDLGVFCKRLPRVMIDYWVRHGAQPAVVEYVQNAFANGESSEKVLAAVQRIGPTDGNMGLAGTSGGYGPFSNTTSMLKPILPYIYNVHGKFYEMQDDLTEYSIPYDQIVSALIGFGYTHSIDSEYEGQRWTQDAVLTDSCEQVRRQHVMLRRLLGEISA